jgi:hypothetical protein
MARLLGIDASLRLSLSSTTSVQHIVTSGWQALRVFTSYSLNSLQLITALLRTTATTLETKINLDTFDLEWLKLFSMNIL